MLVGKHDQRRLAAELEQFSDRISACNVVMDALIPDKGAVLTALVVVSAWFATRAFGVYQQSLPAARRRTIGFGGGIWAAGDVTTYAYVHAGVCRRDDGIDLAVRDLGARAFASHGEAWAAYAWVPRLPAAARSSRGRHSAGSTSTSIPRPTPRSSSNSTRGRA